MIHMAPQITIERKTEGPLIINLSPDRVLALMSRRKRVLTLDEYIDLSSFPEFEAAIEKGLILLSGLPDDVDEIKKKDTIERDHILEMEWDDYS